jgi:hypothetical protein
LLEFQSRKQRHVCRSTFAAELFAATDTADLLYLIGIAIAELKLGNRTLAELRQDHEQGTSPVTLVLAVDAYSLFSSIQSKHVKLPAEKSLTIQLQWLREQVQRGSIKYLVWMDTRDMAADGLTKGSCERELLHAIMSGKLLVRNAVQITSKQPG